jgi:TIR domain
VKVFISYSHKDEIWKDRLMTHLSVLDHEGLLHVWTDRRIEVGASWKARINEAMSDSRVAVLLITANFLTSEFILNEEVPPILERHAQRGMLVLPLLEDGRSMRRDFLR